MSRVFDRFSRGTEVTVASNLRVLDGPGLQVSLLSLFLSLSLARSLALCARKRDVLVINKIMIYRLLNCFLNFGFLDLRKRME